MIEYNSHLQSVLIPDSERAYQLAIMQSYENTSQLIRETNGKYTKYRATAVLKAIEQELLNINRAFSVDFVPELADITFMDNKALAEETTYIIQSKVITAVALYSIPKSQIEKAISILAKDNLIFTYLDSKGNAKKSSLSVKSLFSFPADNAIRKAKSIITAGMVSGDTPDKINRDLKAHYTTGQIRDTRTTVRTIIAQSSQEAHTDFYDKYPDDIERWKYIATLDLKTSSICRSLDGRNWNEKPPSHYFPALHPNCRSKMIALPYGYTPAERPVNIMTAKDKKKARGLRGAEREAFLKTKIKTTSSKISYKQALEMYPQLGNKKMINTDEYFKKLGF